jgi:hypothetical protein
MKTWSEVLALILRDPVAFWPVLIFYGVTVWAVFKFAYWQRGQRERAKMEGLKQHLRYLKQKEADLRGAYEAEWQARTNNEKPEVVDRSADRTKKAFNELYQATKETDVTLERFGSVYRRNVERSPGRDLTYPRVRRRP